MKVILTEKVSSLGSVGDLVKVSPGFGRNYLIPRGLAVIADETSKKQVAHMQKLLTKKVDAQKEAAAQIKKKIEGVTINLTKKIGGSGRLFGTVTSQELSIELGKLGHDVERRLISVDTPIKNLGTFNVKAKLFKDVEAVFKVKVEMDPEQVKEEQEKAARRIRAKKEEAEAAKNAPAVEATEAVTESEE